MASPRSVVSMIYSFLVVNERLLVAYLDCLAIDRLVIIFSRTEGRVKQPEVEFI
jgi:hypothetical protein